MAIVATLNAAVSVIDLFVTWNITAVIASLTCIVTALVAIFGQLVIRNLSNTL
jgi:hypothetical protein